MAQDIIDESDEPEDGERGDNSNLISAPTPRQLSRRRMVESVVKEEATYRECARMERQYKEDAKKLVERTMEYLKHLGLVDNESDLERLATTNLASKNPELSQRWLSEIQNQREELDSKTELMKSQRQSLQSILDNVAKMETEIKELQAQNKRIYATCTRKRNAKGIERAARDRMLMDKIGNEQRIMELKSLVKKAKTKHLDDFTALEKMRKEVDDSQEMYNEKVGQFKKEIGLTKEAMDNFMVGIYNKFQDEILEHDNKR
jgi:DNA repair exonuclease SbcCD ATPase subunit